MLSQHMEGSDRRWDIIHPSELSHQKTFCPRAVYLRITEGPLPPDKFDWGQQNIFDEGHNIHAKWQQRLRDATPLWGNWRCIICDHVARNCLLPQGWLSSGDDVLEACDLGHGNHIWEYMEVSLNAEEELLMAGHADGAAWTTLAEIKSVGTGTVRIEDFNLYDTWKDDLSRMWKEITRPFKTHVNQVDIYLGIARLRGLPFTSAEFIYECKWNQQVKNFTIKYSEERSGKLLDQARAIKYSVDHNQEPACRFPEGCENCAPYDARRAA